LVESCKAALLDCGVRTEDILVLDVPGAFELPFAADCIARGSPEVDAVVCLGCLIKGETMHFEYICEAMSQGIMRVGLDTGVPCVFGVLTCLTEDQARARNKHGKDWGITAIEMALIRKAYPRRV
jgi:6,7-dimethyl-8-ribityllumazine synthase